MRPMRDFSPMKGTKTVPNVPEGRPDGKKNNGEYMSKDRFDIKERENMGLITEASIVIDKETGVNYLYVCRGYGGGLTPLLDSDGKPIVTKDGYKK